MPVITHYSDGTIEVRKACVGAWENNIYVVACTVTRHSVIIDAAAEPDTIERLTAGTTPTAILTTHGHSDHVGAVRAVAERLEIPFRMHPDDASLAGIVPDEPIGTSAIAIGEAEIRPIHTPGHTPGSTSFATGGVVFTGDTLFPGGPGNTRSDGASFTRIIESIESQLFALEDDTIVMPGHGLDTTIGTERHHHSMWIGRGW